MRHVVMTIALAVVGQCSTPAAAQQSTPIAYRPGLLVQIGVANLDRSIAFYTGTLGFTLTERRNDLKFAHLDTNVSGLQIGLNEVPAPKGSGSIVLNISVVDVVSTRRQLESRGLAFRGETVIIPGKVALAEFADPDGNILRFAGPPPARKDPLADLVACADPAGRALDFWIGDWEVRNARGQLAATSVIEPVAGGCGVVERYRGEPGPAGNRYVGAGLHAFDPATTSWSQLWIDTRPAVTEMRGRSSGGGVTYEWIVTTEQGRPVRKRYLLSKVDDGVRQLGERSDDDGATWTVEFDLRYRALKQQG
jgi:catechol 2,3-dioxygenase-like lactoylglutathione lyase family enzyme